ncbi:MAG: dihydrodipicolinate synthase family protein [Verrucomicrobiota bacterium]
MNPIGIKGLVVATVTPMHEDGRVNHDRIGPQLDYLAERNIPAVYLLGSTGEGILLTDEERKQVAESFLEVNAGRMKTFVQVGHNSWEAAAALAHHAASIGADAISATPPGYFKPESISDLVGGIEQITRAAPETPFYYYHIPAFSGVEMDVVEFTRLAAGRIESFAGMKYSDRGSLHLLPALREAAPDKEFLSGSDESYLMTLAQGFEGAVGSTFGYGFPFYENVQKSFEAGRMEEARRWQTRAQKMIDTFFQTCGRAGIKAMWSMVGIDCGPVRSPIPRASEEQIADMRRRLDAMGFFEWCTNPVMAEVS